MLLWRSRVGELPISIDATDIHDTNAVGVVTFDMSSSLFERPTELYATIEPHYEVIANAVESLLTVPTVDVFCCHIATFGRG